MRPRARRAFGLAAAGLLLITAVWVVGWMLGGESWGLSWRGQSLLVRPYLQPGTNQIGGLPLDSSRLVWFAKNREDFVVDYGSSPAYGRTAAPERVEIPAVDHATKHVALLSNLPLDAQVFYRVRQGTTVVAQASFATRKSPTNTIHFVAVGDTVHASPDERHIAWQISRRQPDFLLHLGDIVYFKGTVREYLRRLWPCYNDPRHFSPEDGAPLMATVPFWVVLGNHDVNYGLDLGKLPDGLAAFYFFHSPDNGPRRLSFGMPVRGSPRALAEFEAGAGPSYPGLCFYSFENGPAHFLCLDGNTYTDFKEPALREWIERDLGNTGAGVAWKFVVCHQPAFQTAIKEYDLQQLRLLSPLFAKFGVDVIFSGHTHNYQRTRPLQFLPHGTNDPAHPTWANGEFRVDEHFDGVTNVHPVGIIQVVSGGGGARLFDGPLQARPVLDHVGPANWVPYTARLIADRHSFSDVTVTPTTFTLRQIDDHGGEIDRFEIRKPGTPGL